MLTVRLRLLLQYRAAAIAGFCTQLFWGLIRMMIFVAFYENASGQPMDLKQVVSYVWLGQAFILLTMLRIDGDIQQLIRSGNVAYELLRPVDLYGMWFARTLAGRITPVALRAVPLLTIAALAGWIAWPGLAPTAAFAAAIIGAMLLSAALSMIANITTFWSISGLGPARLLMSLTFLLSGSILPLPLFPDSWQTVLALLPFRGISDAPFRLFSGNLPPSALPAVLAHQAAWVLILVLTGQFMLARLKRRLVIQGG